MIRCRGLTCRVVRVDVCFRTVALMLSVSVRSAVLCWPACCRCVPSEYHGKFIRGQGMHLFPTAHPGISKSSSLRRFYVGPGVAGKARNYQYAT